ncbi:MAG: TlpA family protein disulfide reductase, partial [Gammaproteobacteria bacterium]|nr:TlpA family protein disulfide reductase [Gammaproteobacteria bacterium]
SPSQDSAMTSAQETMTVTEVADVSDQTSRDTLASDVRPAKHDNAVSVSVRSETKAPTPVAPAPELTAAQAILNLEQYRGKVVYLDFWASWCKPCQQTFPWMDKMQKKYPDDIVFLAVNFGESPEDTQTFLKKFPADIKIIYDPLVQIGSEYGVPGLPYSFIYGRKGELLGKHAGFSGGSEINLEAALQNLFASGE